jgi:hypothetical protein
MVKIAIWLLAICLSGILYRAGGQGKESTANPKWMPIWLRKSWVRDWLLPALLLLPLLCFWQPSSLLSWALLLPYYGLSGGALSTYWDWTNKGEANFYLHGFACGLAGFCLITFVPWWVLTLRLIICTLGMGYFSKIIDFDELEEEIRGVFFIL